MSAQIEETLLERYRLDTETLRDLDAILHQRCQEIDPAADIEYHLRRRDGLLYKTLDVEEVLRERNGLETRIDSVTANSTGSNRVQLTLGLGQSLTLSLQSEDRAKAVLTASDLRALARERMKASVSPFKARHRRIAAFAALAFFIGSFIYSVWATDVQADEYNAAVSRYDSEYEAWREGRSERNQEDAETFRAQVDELITSGTTDDRLNLLLERWALDLEQLAEDNRAAPEYPDEAESAGLSGYVTLGGTLLAYALTLAALNLTWPTHHTAFLIGDGLTRDTRWRRNRERLVWGVIVALVLGVVSSVIASAVFGA